MRSAYAATHSRLAAPPLRLSSEGHEAAEAELDACLAGEPQVLSVFRLGTLSHPGISDIDRIAVVAKPVDNSPWEALSAETREVAMHTPFLVDVETFREHPLFAHLEPLELVHGSQLETRDHPSQASFRILLGAEGLVVALLSVERQLAAGTLRARPLLCQLNAIRHSLTLAELAPDHVPGAWQLVADVTSLRGTWFERQESRDDELRGIVGRASAALREALAALPNPEHPPAADALHLCGAPWRGTVLVPGAPSQSAQEQIRRVPWPLTHFGRLANRLVRARRQVVRIPAPGFEWLASSGSDSFSHRRAVVERYRQFLDRSGSAWSAIGFAPALLPRLHSPDK